MKGEAMIHYKRTTILIAFAMAVSGSSAVRAQQDQQQPPPQPPQQQATVPASEPDWQQKYEELEKKLNALEDKLDAKQAADATQAQQQAAKEKTAPILKAGADGFALQSADGNYVLRLRGYMDADGRFYLDDKANNATDTFLMRKVRPVVEGTLARDFDFRIMTDFGNGATVLEDAYVEWKYWPWLKLRAGKYKPPVGLEQLQSDTDLLFVERGLPTDLVPQRDVGAQLSGSQFNGVVSYAGGIFNGVVDNGIADVAGWDSKEAAGRIFLQPFKNTDIAPLQGLGFGVGGTYGIADLSSTTNLPAYKSVGQLQFFGFDKGVTLDGEQLRGTPQAYYSWGPLGVLGEYTVSQEEVRRGTESDTLRNNAWQVEASLFLTGEQSSYRQSPYVSGLAPNHPFDLKTGGWGAFEVVGRFGKLNLDPEAFSQTPAAAGLRYADPTKNAKDAREWGVGLNWYLNRNVKWVFDYEQTDFTGGAGTETGTAFTIKNRATERIAFTRIQVLF